MNFPQYTIYSLPLLLLGIQVLLCAFILFRKYLKTKNVSFFLLSVILVITCWHRTTYTIGFMSWYDTYPNTKVNYFLIDLSLGIGPLICFYIKSITNVPFRWKRKDLYHFIPVFLYVIYMLTLYVYDSIQVGFSETQNGKLMEALHWKYLDTFIIVLMNVSLLLYLVFSIYTYNQYRNSINQAFSNTYSIEFRWVRNFLYAFLFLLIYSALQSIIDGFITDLWYTHVWWYHLCSLLIALYLGVTGLYTDTSYLNGFNSDAFSSLESNSIKEENKHKIAVQKLELYIHEKRSYLDPDLTLSQLSKELSMFPGQLSEIINSGIGKNFNDYINYYRVEAVKNALVSEKYDHFSLLAIAEDCGFNSKATFNRVFKKMTGTSPSEYKKNNRLQGLSR